MIVIAESTRLIVLVSVFSIDGAAVSCSHSMCFTGNALSFISSTCLLPESSRNVDSTCVRQNGKAKR